MLDFMLFKKEGLRQVKKKTQNKNRDDRRNLMVTF
jgi:hypothetical protein